MTDKKDYSHDLTKVYDLEGNIIEDKTLRPPIPAPPQTNPLLEPIVEVSPQAKINKVSKNLKETSEMKKDHEKKEAIEYNLKICETLKPSKPLTPFQKKLLSEFCWGTNLTQLAAKNGRHKSLMSRFFQSIRKKLSLRREPLDDLRRTLHHEFGFKIKSCRKDSSSPIKHYPLNSYSGLEDKYQIPIMNRPPTREEIQWFNHHTKTKPNTLPF